MFTTVIIRNVINIAGIIKGLTDVMLSPNIKAVINNFPASPTINHFITNEGDVAAEYLKAQRAKKELGPIDAAPPRRAE